jgi:hypothetical protein
MDNALRNKQLYKLFLIVIKYIPTILALAKILSLSLSYFGVTSFLLTCLSGTSILFLGILYLISIIFRFCGLYRLSLNYVTLITGISICDWYFDFPIEMLGMYTIYAVISGVFITSWIVYWYKHRNNPKIDHIKQLCDSYC